MRCIFNPNTDPYFNLATEEYALTHFDDDVFMLWRNDKAVIVGKFQNTAAEIDIDYVKEKGIKVVRRMTGGGAVFHDLGNLNFTFIAARGDGDFHTFTEPILHVLNEMGVPAQFEGRNDLTIHGQKFSGNAQCVYRGRILHHGTLLFSSEMSDLAGALKVNPLKFQDKAVKSVRKRVTNISEHLPYPMDVLEFKDKLMAYVVEHTADAYAYSFSDADLNTIERLRDEKYSTWEWNFGTSPKFSFSKYTHTAMGGNLEVHLTIDQGRIAQFKLYGDFFALGDVEELERALVGTAYRDDAVRQTLREIGLPHYLRNVTDDEFVQAMF